MWSSASILLLLLSDVWGNDLRSYQMTDDRRRQEMKCPLQLNRSCLSTKYIKFYLYSRDQKKEELNLSEKYAPESYDSSTTLKVLIHGYDSIKFMNDIFQGYLQDGSASVLVVDWQKLARKPCYITAKLNTVQVGKCTGEAVALLKPRAQVHIVGFSLGAHVAGHVADHLQARYGIKIDRITGLDPALPLYTTLREDMKLDKSDAAFVDIIHTDAGIYGKAEPSGHVDFYVNDATIQPGCYNVSNPPLCSHLRVTDVFAESITSNKGFWGIECPSLFSYLSGYCRGDRNSTRRILMGENVDPSSRGIYLVRTNRAPPYALGREKKIDNIDLEDY